MLRAAASAASKALRPITKARSDGVVTAQWEQQQVDHLMKAGIPHGQAKAYVACLRVAVNDTLEPLEEVEQKLQSLEELAKKVKTEDSKLRARWTLEGAVVGAGAMLALMASVN